MSGDGDKDDFTADDWMLYAEELEKQLKEKDDEIAELNKGTLGKGKRRGNDNAAMLALEEEISSLQDKVKADQIMISGLRKDLADSNVKATQLGEEKADAEKKIRMQAKQIDDLDKEMKEIRKKAQSAETQTKDFNKQKSVNVKLAQQLTEENEAMREENAELHDQIKLLKNEKLAMDEIIAKFAEEREALSVMKDHGETEKEQLHREMSELENDLAEASEHLQVALREAAMWEDKCKLQAQEMTALRSKHASDLAREEAEKQELRTQISNLRDNSKLGSAQRQAEEADVRCKELTKQLAAAQSEVKKLLAERQDLDARLATAEDHIDDAVAERIAAERTRAKTLEIALQSLKDSHVEEAKHWESTQQERDDLVKENDDLKNWKAVYEAGHGLQQLARNQKKLTDDNRRLTQALEQRTTQYSALMDAHTALSLAFEKLQKETGRTVKVDLASPDLAEEVKNTASGLQMQIRELEDQLNALEEDNSRLRKQMRTQMGTMSEGGFKYPGLGPEQLIKVNEFAANLRDGKVELPLDDKSKALMVENKQLKKDLASMNAALLKHERLLNNNNAKEGDLLSHGTGEGEGGILSDAFGMDIKTLLQENAAMQQALNEIKARLESSADSVTLLNNNNSNQNTTSSNVLASPRRNVPINFNNTSNSGFGPAELARILAHNNEMILKELESLRRSQNTLVMPVHNESMSISVPSTGRRPPLAQQPSRATLLPPTHAQQQQPVARSTAESPFPWTPYNGRVSNNNSNTGLGHRAAQFHTPSRPSSAASVAAGAATPGTYYASAGPQTPFGKTMLQEAVQPLNLPPEEWAGEVKDLYAQLVQCLEQLFERDTELEQTRGFVRSYEQQLGDMKLQMSILYHDFAQRSRQWSEQKQTQTKTQQSLQDEIDDLRLKVRRLQEMNLLYQKEDEHALQNKLAELTRRAMIFEVNETVLSRKYVSATESLAVEQKKRADLQADFVEMEAALKERILFLEHFKETATLQLTRLQTKLDGAVPSEDFQAAMAELSSLREDHLHSLRRQTENASASLSVLDIQREMRSLRLVLSEARHDTERVKAENKALQSQLIAQTEASRRLSQASQSAAEVASLVTELAKYKGETSRLDFELQAQTQRVESLTQSLAEVLTETETLSKQLAELKTRETDLLRKESEARNASVALQLTYQQGLTRDEAQTLKLRLESIEEALRKAECEAKKQKELAEIASNQATQARHFQTTFETELKEMREYCAKLESKGDDEVIIGRMQRELLSTKASYRAFARKYQVAREGVRHREVALRLVETQLLAETQSRHSDVSRYQQSLSALAAAMETLKSSVLQIDFLPPAAVVAAASTSQSANANSSSSGKKELNQQQQHQQLLSQQYRRTSYVTFPVGAKVAEVSTKLDAFAVQAQEAVARAQQKEDETRRWQNDFEDLSADKSSMTKRLQDLENLLSQAPAKQQQLAGRIIALSEENRVAKVAALQSRRQVAQLREEMKHLRSALTQLEAEVVSLERAKVEAEAQALRGHRLQQQQQQFSHSSLTDPLLLFDRDNDNNTDSSLDKDNAALNPLAIIPFFTSSAASLSQQRLSIDTNNLDDFDEDNKQYSQKQQKQETQKLQREIQQLRAQHNSLNEDIQQWQTTVQEKDAQLNYYEKLLKDHNLGGLLLRPGQTPLSSRHHSNSNTNNNQENMSLTATEQMQMQAAATATVSSLKQLLEEKNRTIESYRDKVERLLSEGYGLHKTRATQRADDLLDDLSQFNAHPNHSTSRPASPTRSGQGQALQGLAQQLEETNRRLTSQLEAAETILQDKDNLVNQLEQKLLSQNNQRERAEVRCAETLDEMEAMKLDMVTLLRQLQDSEARLAAITRATTGKYEIVNPPVNAANLSNTANNTANTEVDRKVLADLQKKHSQLQKRVKDMDKLLKAKDDKVKGYRDIIVRLKDEFVKSEEEKAINEINIKSQAANSATTPSGVSSEELRHMRDKVAALSDGLKLTKHDLDTAKKARDKLQKERNEAQENFEKTEDKLKKSEQQVVHAQNVAARYRKELEEMRKKEVRLREKLKEFVSGNANTLNNTNNTGSNNKTDSAQKLREKNDALERDIALLRAQLALYQDPNQAQSKGQQSKDQVLSNNNISTQALSAIAPGKQGLHDNANNTARSVTGGHVLGHGEAAPTDELRATLAHRWEAEKKQEKRLAQMEKRLAEVNQENNELRDALAKLNAANNTASTNNARSNSPTRNKRNNNATIDHSNINNTSTPGHKASSGGVADRQQVLELDTARRRVFELEGELTQMRRKADVELTGQIRQLQAQLASAMHQLRAAESELAQHEERSKKSSSANNNNMRQSEERYLREERLRDELDFARRQRLELEAQLLERDALTMELRFESEAKAAERLRLQRRVKELEDTLHGLREANNNNMGEGGLPFTRLNNNTTNSNANNSSRREAELESVVESMKRVVEKLRADNERLRRGVSGPLSGANNSNSFMGNNSSNNNAPGSPQRNHNDNHNNNINNSNGEMEKRLASERKKNDKLTEELNLLRAKVAEKEDNTNKFTQKSQQVTTLQKKLQKKEEELQRQVSDIARLVSEKELLAKRVATLETQLSNNNNSNKNRNEGNRQVLSAAEEEEILRQLAGMQAENDSLRLDVADLRRKLNNSNSINNNNNSNIINRGGAADTNAIERLKEENQKLKAELAAFDLDFFEEIENLKFAHAEAVRKLKVFEARHGPLR